MEDQDDAEGQQPGDLTSVAPSSLERSPGNDLTKDKNENFFEEESPLNSMDIESADPLAHYNFNNVYSGRLAKQEKLRSVRGKKEPRDKLLAKTKLKDINTVDQGDAITNPEKDESPDRFNIQRRKHKLRKTSRSLERDRKSTSHVEGPQMLAKQEPLKVDSPNRFLSLNSKPVTNVPHENSASPLEPLRSYQRRQLSHHPEECPPDRVSFHETFKLLVNMGTKPTKEGKREKKDYNRQISSEQEIWQTKLNDLVWLELQAWHCARTVKEQDIYLCKEREKVETSLQEIMKFMFTENESARSLSSEGDLPAYMWTQEHIYRQLEAIEQVTEQLEKLEHIEQLFPTTKALGKESDLYSSVEFTHKVNTLYVWLNVTKELGHALNVATKVLGVYQDIGIRWPRVEYEDPSALQTGIGDDSDDDDEEYEDEDDEEDEYATDEGQEIDSAGDPAGSDGSRRGAGNRPRKIKNVRFSLDNHSRPQSPEDRLAPPVTSSTPVSSGVISHSSSVSSLSRTSSEVSLTDQTSTSMYRPFADKNLKKMGMKKLVMRLKDLLDGTLHRAKRALEGPSRFNSMENSKGGIQLGDEVAVMTHSPSWDLSPEVMQLLGLTRDRRSSLPIQGAWSEGFDNMKLPSFRPAYLFLVRVPLDVIHECLRLRLEQRILGKDPSLLSIKQLIRECMEVLKAGVLLKQYYRHMVAAVMWDDIHAEEKFEMGLEQFDADMKEMLEVYFSYLQTWMCSLQNLPEASRALRNALEEHWTFTKEICAHILGGEAEAGKRFCTMASSLLNSIADFLEIGIDECIHNYDSTMVESVSMEHSSSEEEGEEEHTLRHNRSTELRQGIIRICRDIKNLFHEARERAAKAVGFAKMLRKDLEIAADFNILVEPAQLLEKLKETDHIKVNAPANAGYLMFIPHHISEDKEQILQLLNVTCGREDIHHSFPVGKESHEGYLLLVRWETGTCGWEGTSVRVEPTAETTIALSHIEVEGLLLVVINSSQLPAQRKSFKRSMGSAVELVNEQTSCHQAIAESLIDLKTTAMYLREKVAKAIIQVDEKLNLDDISEREEMEKYNILKLYRETMHQCYNFGFEYHKEVTRLVTGDARQKLAHGLISFAKEWTKFVTQKCERGRGVKPRWAMQGLEFLTVACEARVLALLTEGEFLDLKHSINNCISHVIGSSSDKTGSPNFRTSSPDPVNAQRNAMIYRNLSCPEPAPSPKPIRTRSVLSDPATSPHPSQSDPWLGGNPAASPSRAVEIHDGENGGIVMDVHVRPKGPILEKRHSIGAMNFSEKDNLYTEKQVVPRVPLKPMERVHQAVARLEQDQNERLLAKRRIGRITTQRSDNNCHLHMRRVHFKWQRGNKIGEGQFGKVYCAVNMDNGELMAMKEIRFQPNDHQTIKDIADEISLFESIQHQSLVRYFGVEVHRDEMVIFMEYCDEGTIEEAAKMGLTEPLIRKYTKEILVAISLLHDNKIVHRDIKGANIFLQSKGPLKLGDFGCSVKLKNHTTMPGEINTLVGTTAYMAPEVITHNDREGHGRAADIWSLGCVVIEMATGKRPWHELENNYQIMFKVGMGCKPAIPDTLSEEGKDFLSHCLEIDPRERWTASQLLGHSFTKFALDDEVEEQESHQPRVLAMPHAISESEEA